MNKYQKTLYENLMKLVEETKFKKRPTFVFKDVVCKYNSLITYRIFNYQLANYTDFSKKGAMQCRGTMFVLNSQDDSIKLCSLPMDKFFGLGENPSTMNINPEDIKEAYIKVDGSLISSYVNSIDTLGLKSKSEPIFVHANIIEEYLKEHDGFAADLLQMSKDNLTVDLEFVSSVNRVILEYKEPALHILNVRDNLTGDYLDFRSLDFLSKYPYIQPFLVKSMDLSLFKTLDSNNKVLKLDNIEGAVLRLADNTLIKAKTEWYMSQHNYVNIQDFSKAGEKLFMVVMNEATDELRSLLHYRNHSVNFKVEEKLALIDKAEEKVKAAYGEFLSDVYSFVEDNRDLSNEDFLNKAKSEKAKYIGMLMPIYKGNYKSSKEAFIAFYSRKIKL
jgi:T4 RnlA family RNA ligase